MVKYSVQRDLAEKSTEQSDRLYDNNKAFFRLLAVVLILFKGSVFYYANAVFKGYVLTGVAYTILASFIYDFALYTGALSIYHNMVYATKYNADIKRFSFKGLKKEQLLRLLTFSMGKSLLGMISGFNPIAFALVEIVLFMLFAITPFYIIYENENLLDALYDSFKYSKNLILYYASLLFGYVVMFVVGYYLLRYVSTSMLMLLFWPLMIFGLFIVFDIAFKSVISFVAATAYHYKLTTEPENKSLFK